MASTQEQQLWLDLQRETLSRVHGSWLPSIPAELLAVARAQAIGRRCLAMPLATVSPILFGQPAPADSRSAARLLRAGWLLPLLRASLDCALDLGSIALGATVRRMVKRSAVVKLRDALGPERYGRILRAQAGAPATDPAAAVLDEDTLIERLTRSGVAELIGYATRLHPAWGESFKLTFERTWCSSKVSPPQLLLPDIVEAALRAAGSRLSAAQP
jgi:hypothetical protein